MNTKLVAAFDNFKRESQAVKTRDDWLAYEQRAIKYIMMLREAKLDSYYQTALTYYDAACKRYE